MGVALTFDDGPHPINTPRLLAILEEFQVSVTFFVVGQMVKAQPGVLRQISASPLGHQICSHSWSHQNFKKLTDADVRKEIEDTEKQIEDVLGVCATRVLRPPYGAITPAQREIPKDMGYRLEGWNVDPNDWKTHDVQVVTSAILNYTHEGNVVLSHDIHASTVEAMKTVVPALKKKFMLGTVSRLNLFTTGALG
jgi:peptidoglycan/xylan/chitin deacetylase (PgdA/CDA1 family)